MSESKERKLLKRGKNGHLCLGCRGEVNDLYIEKFS